MNAHTHITNMAASAKALGSAIDRAKVTVGSIVMVGPHSGNVPVHEKGWDAEGTQMVAEDRGDVLVGDTGDKFLRVDIKDVLDAEMVPAKDAPLSFGYLKNEPSDATLNRLGAELVELLPVSKSLWEEVRKARAPLDLALGDDILFDSPQAHALPEWVAWEQAHERFNPVAERCYMLITAITRAKAHTFMGHAYKTTAVLEELINDAGIGTSDMPEVSWEARTMQLLSDEAVELAARYDPPKPTGTLADLIAAHETAWKVFGDTCDAEDEASSALKKISVLTPAVIKGGRPVEWTEIFGYYTPTEAKQQITARHERWLADLCYVQVEAVSKEAAALLKGEVDASLTECLRQYEVEAAPKLAVMTAPFDSAIELYEKANEAEGDALDNVLFYRPTTLSEVAMVARYLREAPSPSPDHLVIWLNTLSTLYAA